MARPNTLDALRRAATLWLAVFVVACAAQEARVTADEDPSLTARLFSVGYRDIADIYIEDVTVAELALSGLHNLSSLDPDMTVTDRDGRVTVSLDGKPAGNLVAPHSRDSEGWANLTAAVLDLGRSRSEELGDVKPERLYEVLFDGVFSELDSYSGYAGREEARENRASRDGFGGIGVRIRLMGEGVRILSVMEDTPAERSGLLDNDIITAIDGQPTVGLNQREVVRRLRGPLRSTVDLTVRRDDAPAPLNIQVVRAHIVPQTVKYARLGDVAHIRMSGFNQSTARSLRDKIRHAFQDIGPGLAGFVLDLRGNPGGLLEQAVAVADLFVTSGRIVSTHGRHPDSHQDFEAEPDDLTEGRPVVVLVNGNSASASEIVAAALQDAGRAVVVGTSSFGKGTVQTVLRLPNDGELTLTWARFHAPTGYGLSRRGIMPDICTSGEVTGVEDVLERLRKGRLLVDYAVLRRDIDPRDEKGVEAFRASCPPRQGEPEVELEVAQRLLEDPELWARALRTVGPAPETAEQDAAKAAIARSVP